MLQRRLQHIRLRDINIIPSSIRYPSCGSTSAGGEVYAGFTHVAVCRGLNRFWFGIIRPLVHLQGSRIDGSAPFLNGAAAYEVNRSRLMTTGAYQPVAHASVGNARTIGLQGWPSLVMNGSPLQSPIALAVIFKPEVSVRLFFDTDTDTAPAGGGLVLVQRIKRLRQALLQPPG